MNNEFASWLNGATETEQSALRDEIDYFMKRICHFFNLVSELFSLPDKSSSCVMQIDTLESCSSISYKSHSS